MTASPLPLEGNRILLRQGVALLEQLSDELYAGPRGSWAPVGVQYRHILEHYRSFFAGLAAGRVDYDARARDATPDWRPSSLGRELQFLSSHTLHHYALIKLLLDDTGLDLGPEFGVAPSTLAWQRALL